MRSASGLLSLSSFLFFCLSSLPRPLPPLPPPPSCLLLEATVQILRPLLLLRLRLPLSTDRFTLLRARPGTSRQLRCAGPLPKVHRSHLHPCSKHKQMVRSL